MQSLEEHLQKSTFRRSTCPKEGISERKAGGSVNRCGAVRYEKVRYDSTNSAVVTIRVNVTDINVIRPIAWKGFFAIEKSLAAFY